MDVDAHDDVDKPSSACRLLGSRGASNTRMSNTQKTNSGEFVSGVPGVIDDEMMRQWEDISKDKEEVTVTQNKGRK